MVSLNGSEPDSVSAMGQPARKGEACGESRDHATALSMSNDWMRGIDGMVGAGGS